MAELGIRSSLKNVEQGKKNEGTSLEITKPGEGRGDPRGLSRTTVWKKSDGVTGI